MDRGGHIKLYRAIRDWGWYSDGNTMRVFLELLLTANWKPSEYRGRTIERGQAVFGRREMAEKLGITEDMVRTAIQHLIGTNEITIKTTNEFSIATLVNWSLYQDAPDDEPQREPQQNPSQIPTSNKGRRKNDSSTGTTDTNVSSVPSEESAPRTRGEIVNSYTTNEELRTEIREFIKMRRQIKKPMSEHALDLMLAKLDRLASTDTLRIAVLQQSIQNSWQGLVALKEQLRTQDTRRMYE